MPLYTGRGCKTKACKRKAVTANVAELMSANKSKSKGKKRSYRQIVAIALQTVYGRKR